MQRILLLLVGLLCCWEGFAGPVSKSTAQVAATTFYQQNTTQKTTGALQLYLAQTVTTRLYNAETAQMQDIPVYYVFNVSDGNRAGGFVMIAADDAATPILAYATEGAFDPSIEAVNYMKWAENYKEQLRYIIENKIVATTEIEAQWEALEKGVSWNNGRSAMSVNPLLGTIKWGQTNGFNAQCPYDNSTGSRAVVGCVATAMAQIMKYWAHPAQGTGFHSYNHSTYGTQSVNYGSATYNWAAMPNASASSESAKLSYHCGVAVDMMYSPSGSGAYSSDARNALKNYFDYKSTLEYLYRSNYSTSSWKQLLKADLNSNKPLYYAGTGSGGGHAFVCDGYDNNDYFHFNWGWSGAYDGYFSLDALNPSGVGTGGGTGGFNSNHRVIRGIEPNNNGGGGSPSADLQLYSNLTITPSSPIQYGQAFSVAVDIANLSGTDFTGDIAAALLDANNSLVSFIETKTGESYTTGYFYSRTFSSSNMTNTPSPGTYKVVLYQKETGSANWKAIANGSYTNSKTLEIQTTNSAGVDLYATITPSANPIIQGASFTISTNYHNTSTSNFSGKFSIDLHDMQGNLVTTIDEKTMSLGAGNVYSNNVVFSSTGLNGITPGTYQIAAWMQPTGGNWELVGNGSYSNPIQIDIAEPALVGDVYENNNTSLSAYSLTANYSNNIATVATPGSNVHVGGDYDYYKVDLPAGYSYSIDARVFDSYNTSGSTYDNDVLFSYDIGNGYSDSYDNTAPTINVPNGGTIIFQVASYYEGQTGTYEFSATINRGTVNVNQVEEADNILLYPNPANAVANLEFETLPMDLNRIEVLNALGQPVYQYNGNNVQMVHQISTQDWVPGTYWVLLHTEDAILRKSLLIAR